VSRLSNLRSCYVTLGELAFGIPAGLWLLGGFTLGEFAFGVPARLRLGMCELAAESDGSEGKKSKFAKGLE